MCVATSCETPADWAGTGRLHGRLGGRTGLALSRTIRDFHGVPEGLLRQTRARTYTAPPSPMFGVEKDHSLIWSMWSASLSTRQVVLPRQADQPPTLRTARATVDGGHETARVCTTHPIIYDETGSLAVSTSGAEIVAPIGQLLGADHVVATRMTGLRRSPRATGMRVSKLASVVGRPRLRRAGLLGGRQGRRGLFTGFQGVCSLCSSRATARAGSGRDTSL